MIEIANLIKFIGITIFCLMLAGCVHSPAIERSNTTTLGSWSVTSSGGVNFADVAVRQSSQEATAIQVDIILYQDHYVVDLSLALPPCYQPQHRTVVQWGNVKAGPLSWTTHWLDAGGCDDATATLLYQFSTATDGVKGGFAFAILND